MHIGPASTLQHSEPTATVPTIVQSCETTPSAYTEADRLQMERAFAAKVVFGGALPDWETKGLESNDKLIDIAVLALRSAMQQAIANDQPPGAIVFNKLAILHDSQVEVPSWLMDIFDGEMPHYPTAVQEALNQGQLHVHLPSNELARLAETTGKDPRSFGAYKGISLSA